VQPYVTSWNSFGLLDLGNPMAVMVEGMGGVFLTWNHVFLDVNYAFYNNSPMDGTSALQEAGLKVTGDLGALWAEEGTPPLFGLRSFAGLFWETYDEKGGNDGYWEVGLEPSLRLPWRERQVVLAVPLQLGLSAHDYYFDCCGREQLPGYATAGLSLSTSLPQPRFGGNWYLTFSASYTQLLADNLITINHGRSSVVTGKVGVGFSY
jgi:hypothetical protein